MEILAIWMKHSINTAFTTIRVVEEAKKDFLVTPLAQMMKGTNCNECNYLSTTSLLSLPGFAELFESDLYYHLLLAMKVPLRLLR